MGRPPNPNKRTNMVCVRLSDAEQAILDNLRGGLNRGEWLRQQIRASQPTPVAPIPTGYNSDEPNPERDWSN